MKAARVSLPTDGRWSRMLTADFCPWANRYVYWLKEPVGWFVLATLASILVGIFLTPMGWTLAIGLASLVAVGLAYPWLAIRCVKCRLRPVESQAEEGRETYIDLRIRNLLPAPVTGLVLAEFLIGQTAEDRSDGASALPGIALERVPALSSATYRLPVTPEYRGIYPQRRPELTCAFPFGIWTARRSLQDFETITVVPLVVPVVQEIQFAGERLGEVGRGQRPTDHGDFVGVREFRRGDSLKSIHWAQSARLDRLVICERGGPQKDAIELRLATDNCRGELWERRENLAWRVRIVASLIDLLAARHQSFALLVDGQPLPVGDHARSRAQGLKHLAVIPLDGQEQSAAQSHSSLATTRTTRANGAPWISVCASDDRNMPLGSGTVRLETSLVGRNASRAAECLIDLDRDIAEQLNNWLLEIEHVNDAA